MSDRPETAGTHVLVYEPRVEGHHPTWLRFIAEDLLAGGFTLTLAVDGRPAARQVLEDSLGGLLTRLALLNAFEADGRPRGGDAVHSVAWCLTDSGADCAFLGEFDEIASRMFRRAAVGRSPPAVLRGRVGGIYHRPRFLAAPWWSPNRWLKQAGFRRLVRGGWLNPLLFLDEALQRERRAEFPDAPLFYLPNLCPAPYPGERGEARRRLGVPEERTIFLFYGGGYRRKGLHLAVEAFLGLPREYRAFLLVAGKQDPDRRTAAGIEELVRQQRAVLINRYVSSAEEALSFVASDVVLLPYLHHFGISAVLTQAVAADKPVIASDEQLLGRETREHELGLLFPSGDVAALRACIAEATDLPAARRAAFRAAAAAYARRHSRAAYRTALLAAMGAATRGAPGSPWPGRPGLLPGGPPD
jgi:glycosyltransferase involved in cell wall biosynthesis